MKIKFSLDDNSDIRLSTSEQTVPLSTEADPARVLVVGEDDNVALEANEERASLSVNENINFGGASDYRALANKPSINGVPLVGNKTTEDLEIEAGVSSFNGQTGDVTYTAPVASVNGQTGNVAITVPTKTSDLTNDSGFVENLGNTGASRILYILGASDGTTPTDTASTHPAVYCSVSPDTMNGGNASLVLGNAIRFASVGSKEGGIQIYGQEDKYTKINAYQAANNTVRLPGSNGTLALRSEIPSSVSQLDNDSGFVTSSEVENAIKTPIFYACDATTKAILEQGFAVSSTVVTPAEINTMAKFLDCAEPRAWFAWMNGTELEFGKLSMSINTTNSQGTLFIRGRSSVASGTFAASSAWTVTPNPDIPSKTSDLTNDSGYITLADLPIYNGGVS